jgi:hypothetical protein
MEKQMATEKTTKSSLYKMTAKDMEATAQTLETYAKSFREVAELMRERKMDSIMVTGVPSVLSAFKRLDGHFLSCQDSLGNLAIGEPIPVYDYQAEPEKSKLASKKSKP